MKVIQDHLNHLWVIKHWYMSSLGWPGNWPSTLTSHGGIHRTCLQAPYREEAQCHQQQYKPLTAGPILQRQGPQSFSDGTSTLPHTPPVVMSMSQSLTHQSLLPLISLDQLRMLLKPLRPLTNNICSPRSKQSWYGQGWRTHSPSPRRLFQGTSAFETWCPKSQHHPHSDRNWSSWTLGPHVWKLPLPLCHMQGPCLTPNLSKDCVNIQQSQHLPLSHRHVTIDHSLSHIHIVKTTTTTSTWTQFIWEVS